jgi:hypothetical protein
VETIEVLSDGEKEVPDPKTTSKKTGKKKNNGKQEVQDPKTTSRKTRKKKKNDNQEAKRPEVKMPEVKSSSSSSVAWPAGAGPDPRSKEKKHTKKNSKKKKHTKPFGDAVDQPDDWPAWDAEVKWVPHSGLPKDKVHPKAEESFQDKKMKFRNEPEDRSRRDMTPLDCLLMFFPLGLFARIANWTNKKYAQRCKETNPKTGKPAVNRQTQSGWKRVTLNHIVRMFGIGVLMTCIQLPQYRMYWNPEVCSVPITAVSGIGLTRYENLRRFMSGCDPVQTRVMNPERGEDFHDPVALVRPIIRELHRTFDRHAEMGETQCIDESMVGCKLRSYMQHTVKNKPQPTGFRIFVLADSKTGYAHRFVVDDSSIGSRRPWASATEAVSLELLHGLGPNRRIYADRLFTSVRLCRYLARKHGIFLAGPIKANAKNFPNTKPPNPAGEVATDSDEEEPEEEPEEEEEEQEAQWVPGMHTVWQPKPSKKNKIKKGRMKTLFTDDGLVQASSWQDTGLVYTIQAGHATNGNVERRSVQRNRDINEPQVPFVESRRTISAPHAMECYNQYMGGVDQLDRLLGGRYNFANRYLCHRWNHKLMMALLGFAIANAYIYWRNRVRPNVPDRGGMSAHFQFMWELGEQMMTFDRTDYRARQEQARRRRQRRTGNIHTPQFSRSLVPSFSCSPTLSRSRSSYTHTGNAHWSPHTCHYARPNTCRCRCR